MLKWKVTIAILKAKMDLYLGYLHSTQFSKPSLVCDFMELYRYLFDEYLITFTLNLQKRDFVTKNEPFSAKRKGKREFLNDGKTMEFMQDVTRYFETTVNVARIRVGKRQTLETLLNEEALLLARYLRGEKETWIPRISVL